jgi:(2Fe-2S) ferredoxin
MPSPSLSASIKALGIDQIERHLFLCATPLKPKCCDPAAGLETWTYLKKRLKELNLDAPQANRPGVIFRTKADCLRVCQQGPILLVYPDGIWYRNVTPVVMEQIIQSHLLGDRPLESHLFYAGAIAPSSGSGGPETTEEP